MCQSGALYGAIDNAINVGFVRLVAFRSPLDAVEFFGLSQMIDTRTIYPMYLTEHSQVNRGLVLSGSNSKFKSILSRRGGFMLASLDLYQ